MCRQSAQKSKLASVTQVCQVNLQSLAVVLLLVLGELVLGLGDLELALTLEGDQAHTKVGASKVDGEELALLVTSGPLTC